MLKELQGALAQRDAELKAARAELEALDAGHWVEEAAALGITQAVETYGFTARQCRRVAAAIVREAHKNGLDPWLVLAVIRSESTFNAYAVSGVGAMGLMQLMPDTGSLVAKQHGTPLGRKQNLFDAELNVELGTAYLAQLIGRFGSVEQGLVAYNAGPTQARRLLAQAGSRAGSLTGYSRKVMSEMGRLKAHNAQELAAK